MSNNSFAFNVALSIAQYVLSLHAEQQVDVGILMDAPELKAWQLDGCRSDCQRCLAASAAVLLSALTRLLQRSGNPMLETCRCIMSVG